MKGTIVKTALSLIRQATPEEKIYFTSLAIIGYAIGRVIESQIRKQMYVIAFRKYKKTHPIQPKM